MNTSATSTKKTSWGHFLIPLLLQTALILTIPARALITSVTGQTIILQTVPVDPYDLLRGYSQTLRYNISDISDLKSLKGWEELWEKTQNQKFDPKQEYLYISEAIELYVILEAPKDQAQIPPQPWKAIAVSLEKPQNLPENQVALQGVALFNSVKYGLETYYFPEAKRIEINQKISRNQGNQQNSFVVEVKVDQQGYAIPPQFDIMQNYES
jgi:uncharacterized membrane-anchored protein